MWVAVALAVLTVAVYAPVRHFQLVNWDDQSYVSENPTVLGGLSWHGAWWALTTTHSPYWHPMTWLSLLVDVTIFGRDAGGYHVTSVALHACTSVLLYFIFRRMTRAPGASAFVAAIFAVHPLHVESVAWIAERKDVLSTFFWAITVWTYLRYAEAPGRSRYLVVVGAYALALMSKPMVMTLPVVLLLLDWWPLRRFADTPESSPARQGFTLASATRLVLEKLPLLGMAIAVAIETMIVQRRVGAVAGLDMLPIVPRVENATVSYLIYIWKTLWPSGLAAFYPLRGYPASLIALAAAVLLAVSAAAFMVRARFPHVFVGWFWYVVTVAPVIGLTQSGQQAHADRFMYVPMIGLLIIVAWTVQTWLTRRARSSRRAEGVREPRWEVPALASAIVLACAVTARAQVNTWSDSITLWQHALILMPGNYIAYEDLGQAYRERGDFTAAIENYHRAMMVAPANAPGFLAMLHNDIGIVLTRENRPIDAGPEFAASVQLNPRFAEAHSNFANTLATRGQFQEAEAQYRIALRLKPDFTEAHVGLGGVLLNQHRGADALPEYKAALVLDPSLAEAHNGLGAALAMIGRGDEAMAEYDAALRLRPDLPTAHLNIAVLLIKRGQLADARAHLETALRIDPGYSPARQLLDNLQ